MLKQRLLTAIVLIPLVLWLVIWGNNLVVEIISGLIILGCAYEWAKLAPFDQFERWAFMVLVSIVSLVLLFLPKIHLILLLAVIGWLYAFSLCHRYSHDPKAVKLNKWQWFGLGCLALAPCWLVINALRFFVGQPADLVFLLLLIWGADSGAYFAGKRFGKTPLAPTISPNKSWEGVKGAAYAALLVAVIKGIYGQLPWYLWLEYLLLYFITLVFAIYGDLFESLVKRLSGKKDSGGLLPGHGGLLDRLDSLFAAAPIYALGIILIRVPFNLFISSLWH
jgi:phosphatidate cytidylyltransferase